MQLSVELSGKLQESIQALNDLGSGDMQEQIAAVEFFELKKINCGENLYFDYQQNNKFLYRVLSILNFTGVVNKYVSSVALPIIFCKILHSKMNQSSVINLSCLGFVLLTLSILCKRLCWYINRYIYTRFFQKDNWLYFIYNRNVHHINKCCTYIEENPERDEINNILLKYINTFTKVFRYVLTPNVACFVEDVEQQVEKILGFDTDIYKPFWDAGGYMLPIYKDRRHNKSVLSLKTALLFMENISVYCETYDTSNTPLKSLGRQASHLYPLFFSLIVGIWLNSNALMLACSLCHSIISIHNNGKDMEFSNNAYKYAVELDILTSSNLPCKMNVKKDVKDNLYYRYLLFERSKLYKSIGVRIQKEDVAIE